MDRSSSARPFPNARAVVAGLRSRGRRVLVRRIGVDPRALAALRVSLGTLLVVDLLLRAQDLIAFYADAGVLPRTVLRESYPFFGRVSLHAASGAAWVQAALFATAFGFALALLVGYRTTLATAGSLGLLFSLHARNPLLLNGGDALLLHLLFWGLFLPLGERWSVDAAGDRGAGARHRGSAGRQESTRRRGSAGRRESTRRRVTTVAGAALLIQVVLVYTVNAVLKLRGELWIDGGAVRYVFSLDQFTVLLGDVFANYPALLAAFERLWLGLVVSSALLVVLTGRARAALVALFAGMHLGMALTLRLGVFPFVSVAGLLPFLPPGVWDAVESAVPPGVERRLRRLSTALATSDERTVSTISATLSAVSVRARRLRSPVVTCLLVGMVGWNAAVLGYVDTGGAVTGDDTSWNMFAPDPMRTDGWFVVPGELASGARIDAFHRGSVRWDRPPDVADAYPNERWRKYLNHLRYPWYDRERRAFAGYLCDRWNRRHDDELVRVSVYFVAQPTRLDGPEPTRREELGTYSCSAVGTAA